MKNTLISNSFIQEAKYDPPKPSRQLMGLEGVTRPKTLQAMMMMVVVVVVVMMTMMIYEKENVWISSRSRPRVSLSEVNSCSDCPKIPKRMESEGPLPR
jgi:hypothetical protein